MGWKQLRSRSSSEGALVIVIIKAVIRSSNSMKTLSDYTIVLRPDTKGTFVAYMPAISACHAWGKTT